jgi:PEP-CTERM motif
MKGLLTGIVMGVLALGMVQVASADLINGSFEDPQFEANSVHTIDISGVPGWHTTASDSQIEIWTNNFHADAPADLRAYAGNQFAELNANQAGTLYQDVSGITTGSIVDYHFAHRGRTGVDTMLFSIIDLGANGVLGGGDDNALVQQQFSDNNNAWGYYQGSIVTTSGNTLQFSYEAVSTANGNPTTGNFLDAAAFGVGVNTVPEPSTYALLCISLGVIGFARKKMRKSEA